MNAITRYIKCRRRPVEYFRSLGVRIGEDVNIYGAFPDMFASEPYLIELGNHIWIAQGVKFITHDGGATILRARHPKMDLIAPIKVGNYVLIGLNAIILPGVTIGDNVIIGAGAIVVKDCESGWIYAGNPARKIKTVEEYEASAIERKLECHLMSPSEKKAFLIKKFVSPREKNQ